VKTTNNDSPPLVGIGLRGNNTLTLVLSRSPAGVIRQAGQGTGNEAKELVRGNCARELRKT